MPTKVSASEVEEKCSDEKNGCFIWDGEWAMEKDVLTVKFNNRLLINDKLSESGRQEVLAHEKRHWEIFQRQALELKSALERIAREGRDPDMDNRWEWLTYDICRGDAAFHREVSRFPIKMCLEPSSPRPK